MRRLMNKSPELSIPLQNLAHARALTGIKRDKRTTPLVCIDIHKNWQIPLRKVKKVPLPFPSHLILSRWAIWLRLPLRQHKNLRVKLLPQSRVSDRALPGDAFLRLDIQSEPIGTRRREGSRGQRLLEEVLELTVHHKDPTARLVVPFK